MYQKCFIQLQVTTGSSSKCKREIRCNDVVWNDDGAVPEECSQQHVIIPIHIHKNVEQLHLSWRYQTFVHICSIVSTLYLDWDYALLI